MPSSTSTLEDLLALGNMVMSSIQGIIRACGDTPFPSPDEPLTLESEGIRMSPDVQKHSTVLLAAATQLVATVRSPFQAMIAHGMSPHVPASIQTTIELHVPEILRQAGSQGLHVKDIAAPSQTDPAKLARILRLLATNYFYREVAPDTFAHNRISSLLDTGKSMQDVLADPTAKHDNTMGVAAMFEHLADEAFQSSAHLPDVMKDPKLAHSQEPNEAAFNRTFATKLGMFEWFELPENEIRRKRFGNAFKGAPEHADLSAKGFDWASLPQDSIVVDVGGGFGQQSLDLARKFGHLNFVVQDLPNVIEDAPNKLWNTQYPEALKTGRVKLQVHDIFTLQPVQKPAVFFLRTVLHDWSDGYCLKILRHLRAAAGPDTQLVISENVVEYACPAPSSLNDIPGAVLPPAPAPLLANYGLADPIPYVMDLEMLVLLNGSDRTIASYKSLFEQTGWRLVKVGSPTGAETHPMDTKIIAVPQ